MLEKCFEFEYKFTHLFFHEDILAVILEAVYGEGDQYIFGYDSDAMLDHEGEEELAEFVAFLFYDGPVDALSVEMWTNGKQEILVV
jgi:hypothetical protein